MNPYTIVRQPINHTSSRTSTSTTSKPHTLEQSTSNSANERNHTSSGDSAHPKPLFDVFEPPDAAVPDEEPIVLGLGDAVGVVWLGVVPGAVAQARTQVGDYVEEERGDGSTGWERKERERTYCRHIPPAGAASRRRWRLPSRWTGARRSGKPQTCRCIGASRRSSRRRTLKDTQIDTAAVDDPPDPADSMPVCGVLHENC
ncbi:hypothetical protein BD410DRAFT_886026 [Rickenella mellea]|uniref:Uncharacterized protein n=1 Tax=Rickenella mellea TaxID=50990 RepID=A0A4Y7PP12_9AGAM|nr:hypothetical protein BD410DRAFT_886026 [Rickenella mellea]